MGYCPRIPIPINTILIADDSILVRGDICKNGCPYHLFQGNVRCQVGGVTLTMISFWTSRYVNDSLHHVTHCPLHSLRCRFIGGILSSKYRVQTASKPR